MYSKARSRLAWSRPTPRFALPGNEIEPAAATGDPTSNCTVPRCVRLATSPRCGVPQLAPAVGGVGERPAFLVGALSRLHEPGRSRRRSAMSPTGARGRRAWPSPCARPARADVPQAQHRGRTYSASSVEDRIRQGRWSRTPASRTDLLPETIKRSIPRESEPS